MKSIEERAAIYFGVLEEKRLRRVVFEDALRELAADLNAEKEKEVAELSRSPRIYTRCPACGNDTLTINDDKHLLCTWHKCPNPVIIDNALLDEVKRVLSWYVGNQEPDWECTCEQCRNHAAAHSLLTRLRGYHE